LRKQIGRRRVALDTLSKQLQNDDEQEDDDDEEEDDLREDYDYRCAVVVVAGGGLVVLVSQGSQGRLETRAGPVTMAANDTSSMEEIPGEIVVKSKGFPKGVGLEIRGTPAASVSRCRQGVLRCEEVEQQGSVEDSL